MRGFSLVELMVVIALFTIITGTALSNHARFGENILATNFAYDIALSLREAQSYGLSVREEFPGAGVFTLGYGLHFGLWSGDQKNESDRETSFVFFADKDSDGRYSGSDASGTCIVNEQSECLKVYRLERGSRIASFCGVPTGSGAPECRFFPSSDGTLSFLDADFKRPDPDAFIRTNLNAQGIERYQSARIALISPHGTECRIVEVFSTGQISIKSQAVQNGTCKI